jgi:hypothetical protein
MGHMLVKHFQERDKRNFCDSSQNNYWDYRASKERNIILRETSAVEMNAPHRTARDN